MLITLQLCVVQGSFFSFLMILIILEWRFLSMWFNFQSKEYNWFQVFKKVTNQHSLTFLKTNAKSLNWINFLAHLQHGGLCYSIMQSVVFCSYNSSLTTLNIMRWEMCKTRVTYLFKHSSPQPLTSGSYGRLQVHGCASSHTGLTSTWISVIHKNNNYL